MPTEPNDGGPAFPSNDVNSMGESMPRYPGMSLRDWFAGMAMQGMLSYSPHEPPNGDYHTNCPVDSLAYQAYEVAQAMLTARTAKGEDDGRHRNL